MQKAFVINKGCFSSTETRDEISVGISSQHAQTCTGMTRQSAVSTTDL